MKFFSGILIIAISAIWFSSCQREVDGILPDDLQNDSTNLSRIIVLDTNLVTGKDTLFKINFIYDSQKRKIGEDFISIDNSSGTRDIFYYRYFYNNSDTVPFRASEKYSFSTDSLVSFFTYSNGFIIKDSSVDFVSGTVSSIRKSIFLSLAGNRFLRKETDYDPSTGASQLVDSTIYTRTVNGGNVLNGSDSSWLGLVSPPTLLQVRSFQIMFDNKPNPLSKLDLFYWGYYDTFDNQIYLIKGGNNMISLREDVTFPSAFTEISSYNYSYNSFGYPSILRTNGLDGNKAIFLHTKL